MLHSQFSHTQETVFIVDDDEAVRDSLQWLIETEGYQVRAYADPVLFLAHLQWPQVCVLLLDIRMPTLSGLEVQKALNMKGISIPIVFITGHGDVRLAVETMKNGAVDFLEKPFNELKIKTLIKQQMQLAREVAQAFEQEEKIKKRYAKLSSRELQVLDRIVSGRLNKQIADDLHISIKTVESHRANIMEKLQVDNMADLLKMALRKPSEITSH